MPKKTQTDSAERFSRITAIVSVLFIALVGVLALTYSFAAPKNGGGSRGGGRNSTTSSVNMYISPSSQNVSVGDEFTAAIWVDVGSNYVNAVQANVSFDNSKLQYLSVDSSGSAFGLEAQTAIDGSTIKIARGNIGSSLTGNNYVATVRFRAVDSVRKSQLSFASGSAVINSEILQDVLEQTTKAQVTIR